MRVDGVACRIWQALPRSASCCVATTLDSARMDSMRMRRDRNASTRPLGLMSPTTSSNRSKPWQEGH